jgi:hypothetical protein
VFGTDRYPQMLLRVGWVPLNADPLPPTLRRGLSRVMEWWSGEAEKLAESERMSSDRRNRGPAVGIDAITAIEGRGSIGLHVTPRLGEPAPTLVHAIPMPRTMILFRILGELPYGRTRSSTTPPRPQVKALRRAAR